MEKPTSEDVVLALGNLSALELIALTKQLEIEWGVKAVPTLTAQVNLPPETQESAQTEFNVILTAVPADKKMSVIKMVREVLLLGLKESKDLVESLPKTIKEAVPFNEAEEVKNKFTEAGGVIEIK